MVGEPVTRDTNSLEPLPVRRFRLVGGSPGRIPQQKQQQYGESYERYVFRTNSSVDTAKFTQWMKDGAKTETEPRTVIVVWWKRFPEGSGVASGGRLCLAVSRQRLQRGVTSRKATRQKTTNSVATQHGRRPCSTSHKSFLLLGFPEKIKFSVFPSCAVSSGVF